MNLRLWLQEQGLSARESARELGVPRTTVGDWVCKGAVPKGQNLETLNNFISATCTHHWVIDRPNGPLSDGVCQRCGERREFTNSADTASISWRTTQRPKAQ